MKLTTKKVHSLSFYNAYRLLDCFIQTFKLLFLLFIRGCLQNGGVLVENPKNACLKSHVTVQAESLEAVLQGDSSTPILLFYNISLHEC